jgi:hypothetical protein
VIVRTGGCKGGESAAELIVVGVELGAVGGMGWIEPAVAGSEAVARSAERTRNDHYQSRIRFDGTEA